MTPNSTGSSTANCSDADPRSPHRNVEPLRIRRPDSTATTCMSASLLQLADLGGDVTADGGDGDGHDGDDADRPGHLLDGDGAAFVRAGPLDRPVEVVLQTESEEVQSH